MGICYFVAEKLPGRSTLNLKLTTIRFSSSLCWQSLDDLDICCLLLLSFLHFGCLLSLLIGTFAFPSDLNKMGLPLLRFLGLLFLVPAVWEYLFVEDFSSFPSLGFRPAWGWIYCPTVFSWMIRRVLQVGRGICLSRYILSLTAIDHLSGGISIPSINHSLNS